MDLMVSTIPSLKMVVVVIGFDFVVEAATVVVTTVGGVSVSGLKLSN